MAERRDAVRLAYEDAGISRQDLARRTGLSPSTITNFIAGGVLSRPAAARIGAVIGWTPDEVLAGERDLERDGQEPGEHVSPRPLEPNSRPPHEPRRPPTKPPQRGAAA